jgi:hypothetical protein
MKRKKILFLIGFVFVNFMSCNIVNVKKGDGKVITETRTLSEFNQIELMSCENMKIHSVDNYSVDNYSVKITADSNLIQYVKTKIKNGILSIKTDNGSYIFTKFNVDVYTPNINEIKSISSSSAGDIDFIDEINSSGKLNIDVSGSGNVSIKGTAKELLFKSNGSGNFNGQNFNAEKVSINISGSGDVSIKGTAKELLFKSNGSGNFNGQNFNTEKVSINISGSGDAKVWATESLKVDISGSGDVVYKGNPAISVDISGSGTIKKE